MGLLDTGAGSVPARGVMDGPRETYVPPCVVRRQDMPVPEKTVRDKVLVLVKTRAMPWTELSAALPKVNGRELAAQLSVLIRENLLAINAQGDYAYGSGAKCSATKREDHRATQENTSRGKLEDGAEMKTLLLLLAQRSMESEERYQRMVQEALAEANTERRLRHQMEQRLLAAAV